MILPDGVEQLLKATFSDEVKFVIDNTGEIIAKGDSNISNILESKDNVFLALGPYIHNLNSDYLDKLSSNKSSFTKEFSIPEKAKWFKIQISPLNHNGKSVFLIQIFDITKNKEVEEQLKRHKKSIESEILLRTREIVMTDEVMQEQGGFLQNFLRGLRHDLVSPLSQLHEIIKYNRETTNIDKKKKSSELVDDCLMRLSRTSRGFSDFVDLHFLPHKKAEKLAFNDSFKSAIALLEIEIKKSKANINTNFDNAPNVNFSQNLLDSIFFNLISNSLKFKDESKILEIVIVSKIETNAIVLEIVDNGAGMNIDKFGQQIFETSAKVDKKSFSDGIGLNLVKSIVEKDKRGSIELESQIGKGTKVKISFKILD